MRLSKQLFLEKYKLPKIINQHSTISLLNKGPFYQMIEKGIPLFLPIGNSIISSIENICIKEAGEFELNHIDMTQMVPTEILSLGEDFHQGFIDQFIFLKGKMERYHLLSTPEPLLINFLKEGLKSYRQLPIQMIFIAKFFRQLNSVNSILKSREFRMLAGACLYDCDKNSSSAIENFHLYTMHIASFFDLNLNHTFRKEISFMEYFYVHPDGEESFNDKPAMSIAMSYEYGKEKKLLAKYCGLNNRKMNARFVTYGLGLQRLFFAIFDSCRDDKGFNLPKSIRPFDITIIAHTDSDIADCLEFSKSLNIPAERILIDDRKNATTDEKESFSDFLGIPQKVIVHNKNFLVKHRKYETLLEEAFQTSIIDPQKRIDFNIILHSLPKIA
ncbi:proline--tRNA ligase [Pantoea ananatis]|uniref:proline--tRNA ligase n=1 Tax=Pantoea ananas TaxID=553 RepID=UPI001588F5E4|nr:proline--tRNA ligase [Pantoea ananatis]MBA4823461.1 proline--tRNA ligase [Pantoea ananatis]QKV88034.1 proline--tRNA ligase [Pantoea ananatis]